MRIMSAVILMACLSVSAEADDDRAVMRGQSVLLSSMEGRPRASSQEQAALRLFGGAGRSDLSRSYRAGIEGEWWIDPYAALAGRVAVGSDGGVWFESRRLGFMEPNLLIRLADLGIARLVAGVGFGLIYVDDRKENFCIPTWTGAACAGGSRERRWDYVSSAMAGIQWSLGLFSLSGMFRGENIGSRDWSVTFNLGAGLSAGNR
ncbi:MAG: hypothetical protein HYT79_09335 [Elusimicrobia bacterium]|nr:hypothetical protein [Elusimicrobiota bacterium]